MGSCFTLLQANDIQKEHTVRESKVARASAIKLMSDKEFIHQTVGETAEDWFASDSEGRASGDDNALNKDDPAEDEDTALQRKAEKAVVEGAKTAKVALRKTIQDANLSRDLVDKKAAESRAKKAAAKKAAGLGAPG